MMVVLQTSKRSIKNNKKHETKLKYATKQNLCLKGRCSNYVIPRKLFILSVMIRHEMMNKHVNRLGESRISRN